ncbi:MAG: ABC transporter permease subunit, partial [Anaerolineales bacterium]|nr:ABC transporter permease subunit [Anaerolineales bacterium]
MTVLSQFPLLDRQNWHMALIVTQREVRDTLRDWRMVAPILGLTLFFPALMTFVARRMTDFLLLYDSSIISERAIPLLLMVVGFFPTSFSLVIALEAFAGEKERRSLEPLLSTPLSDAQLYMGKMLASVIPPVLASYIGIVIYSLSVTFTVAPMKAHSMILIVLLTTAHAALMVSAAVVVSTQATSVRAA